MVRNENTRFCAHWLRAWEHMMTILQVRDRGGGEPCQLDVAGDHMVGATQLRDVWCMGRLWCACMIDMRHRLELPTNTAGRARS